MADRYRDSGIIAGRGDTAYLDFTVTVAGAAQDITGWELWFTAKRRIGDGDADAVILKNSLGSGVTILNAALGTASVTLSPADTASLLPEAVRLYADIQGKDGAGHVFTLDAFTFTIRGDVTRTTT